MKVLLRPLRGIGAGLRARPGVFTAVAVAVLLLDVFVPPLVLTLTRKPVDYFTFNPWLTRLPEYLTSGQGSLPERLAKLWSLALFWFSSDNPYGVEWGFAVTVSDLARFVLMGLVLGAYFALWRYHRERLGLRGGRPGRGGQGGVLGVVSSVLGVSSGGCTVMGCGAPMLPGVGLAFVGLSSGTLALLAGLSTVATAIVLGGMTLGVLFLGWRVADDRRPVPI